MREVLDRNTTIKDTLRQEGNLISHALHRLVNLTSSTGLLVMSISSSVDLPFKPGAEEKNSGTFGETVLHGDKDINDLRVLVIAADPDTPFSMLQEVAEDMFVIEPTNQFKDKTTVVAKYPSKSLGCNQGAFCDWVAVNAVTDEVVASGTPVHGVLVIKESEAFSGHGSTILPSRDLPPSNKYPSVVVRPRNVPPEFRMSVAATVVHEFWWHQMTAQGHPNRGDLASDPRGGNFLHPESQKELLEVSKNWPHSYYNPVLRYKLGGSLQSEDQVNPLSSMEFKVPPTEIPAGTRWLKIFIRQEDGPAVSLIIGAPSVIDQIRNGEYKIEAPDIVTGKSFILLKDQLVTASIWGSDAQNQPEWESQDWTQHKAWPKLTVPSNEAKAVFRTPKSATTIGSLTEAKTSDSTPTIRWSSSDRTAYYFEVQMSGDTRFDDNPSTATSFVYWNLIHGGQTKNSWTVPDNAALTPGKYFFRVRERVQGSGTPAAWSQPFELEITPSMLIKAAAEDLINGVKEENLGGSVLKECIEKFLPQMPIDENNILSPYCYRLMDMYQQIRDELVVHDIMNAPRVTLDKGSVQVKLNAQEAILPNRADRRKAVRFAQKAA